ncbi:thioesterase family protein [Williamsia herbipolensis]|uniref:Thioesterase family protein n=1 Tax=Williamsia herbipolensis TaxID=1603258 RepID=A0AAU4K762_9NOCA|nr:thioesterase family protein [Williamsia herbipolensis]
MKRLADLRPSDTAEATADRRTYLITIDPVFTIGSKVHGGALQAISSYAALRAFADTAPDGTEVPADLAPIAVASNFLGAPDPAEVEVVVWVRKRGRRISLVEVEIVQGGRTRVSSSITLGRPDTAEPHYVAPQAITEMPVEPPADVEWTKDSAMADIVHLTGAIDMAYDPATTPMVRGETGAPLMRIWARPSDSDPDGPFAVLCGDLSAPVVMNLGLIGWAPTLQLTAYLRRAPAPGWLRIESSTSEVGAGWFEEDHRVIDSTGALVAQSRQLALIPEGAP